MTMMKGYLTYTLSALAVLGGAAGFLLGTIEAPQAMTMIWAGLAAFGIRRAL